jgi:hypothetical protein
MIAAYLVVTLLVGAYTVSLWRRAKAALHDVARRREGARSL